MKRNHIIIGLIVFLSFVVYSNSFRNSFVYDDVSFISDNHYIKSIKNIPLLFTRKYFDLSKERTYRPVCTLSFLVDHAIWKLNPFGWHLTNVVLHAANAVMVFLLLLVLSKNRIASAAAGFLFAVHPVQTEAVLGISFREDLLCLFFYLLTFCLYIMLTGYVKIAWKKKFTPVALYIASIFSFTMAVYSKEMALTLPLVLLICDLCNRRELKKNDIILRAGKYWLVYFMVAVSFMVLKFTALSNETIPALYPGGNLFTAMLTMTRVVVYYIRLLLYPMVLNVDYVFGASTSAFEPAVLFSTAVIAGILLITLKLYNGLRIAFFAVMFFFINLVPVSNIIPFGATIAERYLYFASVGYFMLAGLVITRIYDFVSGRRGKRLVTAFFLSILVLYSTRTLRRNLDWKDGFTLWGKTLKTSHESYTVHNNLGVAYKKKGMLDEAIKEYRKTIELNPSFVRAINNIGYIYYERKQYDLAIEEYKKAVSIDPEFAEGYLNMGLVYYDLKMYDDAIEAYNKAIDVNYTKYQAYSNLIAAYAQKGMFKESLDAFNKGVKVYPGFADLYKNAGLVHRMMNDDAQALVYWNKYLRLSPDAPDAKIIGNEIRKIIGNK